MIPRKATAFLFLFFSIVVAFYNFTNGKYEHTLLTIPFIAACISYNKISRLFELIGVAISAVYLIIFGELYIGIMGMLVAACMFFAMGYSLRKARIYVYATTLIVSISAYFNAYDITKRLAISILDGGIYFVCVACIYIAFQYHILHFIDKANEAISIAREAINISNKGKGDE